MATAEMFRAQLRRKLTVAAERGDAHLDVVSRDLHDAVGGYRGTSNHRMATCCNVMHGEMTDGDKIIAAPPSGKGATLKIRYQLPR